MSPVSLAEAALQVWLDAIPRACLEGGAALAAAWAVCALLPRLSPAARCWLWRLAFVRLLVSLAWGGAVALPLLPPPAAASGAPAEWNGELPRVNGPVDTRTMPAALAAVPPARPLLPLLLFAGWTLGAGACLLRLRREWRAAGELVRTARPVEADGLREAAAQVGEALGVRRLPALLESSELASPVLVDPLRPAVLLPEGLVRAANAADCRLALAHELAHLRRGDLAWGALPAAAHALFFFHPLVWVAIRETRLAQEMACDSLALAAAGCPAGPYGRLLVRLAARGLRPRAGLAAAGESPRMLERRLRAMKETETMQKTRAGSRAMARTGAAAAILVGAAVLVPFRVTAQEKPAPPGPPPPAVSVTTQAPTRAGSREADRLQAERQALEFLRRALQAERRALQAERAALEARARALEQRSGREGEVRTRMELRRQHAENLRRQIEKLRERVRSRLRPEAPGAPSAPPGAPAGPRPSRLPDGAELGALSGEASRAMVEALRSASAEQQRAVAEVLKSVPGIVQRSLAEARRELGAHAGKLTPGQRQELERKLRELPAEVRKGLAEARRDLDRENGDVSPDLRRQLESLFRELEAQLRTLPDELRRELK